MEKIKLEAKTKNEEIILSYLRESASEMLVEKINSGIKTLAQCWNYIMAEARKQSTNGCACIEDKVVFGWATHFFEEDELKGEKYNKSYAPSTVKTSEAKKVEKYEEQIDKPKNKAKKMDVPQLDQISFDIFG